MTNRRGIPLSLSPITTRVHRFITAFWLPSIIAIMLLVPNAAPVYGQESQALSPMLSPPMRERSNLPFRPSGSRQRYRRSQRRRICR